MPAPQGEKTMKKKIMILCLLCILMPAAIFASVFQLGVSSTWDVPVDTEVEKIFGDVEFSNYDVGLDSRLNIGYLQFQAEIRGKFSNELLLENYGYYLASSLRVDLFFLKLTAGAGIKIGVDKNPVTKDWEYNGQSGTEAEAVFSSAEIYYRAGAGIDFGSFSLELQAMVPSGASWNDLTEEKTQRVIDTIGPKFDRTRVSLSMTANFF